MATANGFSVNGHMVDSPHHLLTEDSFVHGNSKSSTSMNYSKMFNINFTLFFTKRCEEKSLFIIGS